MRRIRYSVAMSLDGFIAGPGGEYDWIPDEPDIDWAAFMSRFDTVLMGRRSYELALASPGGSMLPKMPTYVFSRTLRPEDHPDVTIVADDDATDRTVAELRQAPGKQIWLYGGGELFRSLLARGHVDVIEVAVVPALVGKGIPLLPELSMRTFLRLVDHHVYPKTGIAMLTYELRRTRSNGDAHEPRAVPEGDHRPACP